MRVIGRLWKELWPMIVAGVAAYWFVIWLVGKYEPERADGAGRGYAWLWAAGAAILMTLLVEVAREAMKEPEWRTEKEWLDEMREDDGGGEWNE